jgi:hypothetical protein
MVWIARNTLKYGKHGAANFSNHKSFGCIVERVFVKGLQIVNAKNFSRYTGCGGNFKQICYMASQAVPLASRNRTHG